MIYKNKPKDFKPAFEVVSCYVEHAGRILLLHRHQHKSEGGRWGLPAGKIDEGEEKLVAVIREIKEETGLKVLPGAVESLGRVFVKYPEYHFIYRMFRTKLDKKPLITLSENEHKECKWAYPKNALKMALVKDLDRCIRLTYQYTNIVCVI